MAEQDEIDQELADAGWEPELHLLRASGYRRVR
jgi:hypothetical protein